MDLFKTTTEDTLRDYLIQEGKKSQSEHIEKKIEKTQAETEAKVAKKRVKFYEELFYKTDAEKLADMKYQAWCDENTARKDEELKKDATKLQNNIHYIWSNYETDYNNFLLTEITQTQVNQFNKALVILEPGGTPLDITDIRETVKTLAENKFEELKVKTQEKMQDLADKMIKDWKAKQANWGAAFDAEALQRKLGEIPLTIEDKIQQVKDLLDGLLGRALVPALNPESVDFNLDLILAQMQAVISPLLSITAPLEAVGGKIPILGDLAGVLAMMKSSSGGSKLTKEEIKKLLPKRPSLPANLMDSVKGIFDDIMVTAQMLPMILINIIFQMLQTIVGLFEQIAGVIGVPGIPFPLSLIPNCISALPKMQDFIMKIPVLMYASVKGLLIDKLSEAMALTVPKPNINVDAIASGALLSASIIPKIQEAETEKAAAQSKPKSRNREYNDVISEKLSSVEGLGYGITDLQRILKSYKEIYDGSNGTINKYTGFGGTAKYGNLVPIKETITRTKGTPDEFKAKLDEIFSQPNVSTQVEYDMIKKTASVVGPQYYAYETAIKKTEPNEKVVLKDTISS